MLNQSINATDRVLRR